MRPIQNLFLHPTRFFQANPPETLRRSLTIIIAALAAAGLILAMLTYANLKAIHAQYTGTFSAAELPSPWERLAFPVVWLVIVAANALFRYISARIFGDSADFKTMAYISLHAATPLMVVGFLIGVWTALFPFGPSDAFARGALAAGLFLLTFLYEGFICAAGLREYLQQNTGRAILTWVSPLAGWCGCVAVPVAVFYIALQL
jgi:hypothetical protein